jgi:hypothetical protein
MAPHAISRALNTSLPLSTLAPADCHGLASSASHHSPLSQQIITGGVLAEHHAVEARLCFGSAVLTPFGIQY